MSAARRHRLLAGMVADLGLFKIKIIMLRRNIFLLQPAPGKLAWRNAACQEIEGRGARSSQTKRIGGISPYLRLEKVILVFLICRVAK